MKAGQQSQNATILSRHFVRLCGIHDQEAIFLKLVFKLVSVLHTSPPQQRKPTYVGYWHAEVHIY